jgi:hypothetical protein
MLDRNQDYGQILITKRSRLIKSLPNDIIRIAGRNFPNVLEQGRKLWKPNALEEIHEGRTKE